MSTISDIMACISKDIQSVFGELVKLLLRKTLNSKINPNKNKETIYNAHLGKYVRRITNSSNEDHVGKYNYVMTYESLGWTDEILANFKIIAKFIKKKNHCPQIPPKCNMIKNTNKKKDLVYKTKIMFSDKEDKHYVNMRMRSCAQYDNLLNFLTSKNMQSVISNKKASFTRTSDIPYTHSFKQLESIGKDIIHQTDSAIHCEDSAKMTTSKLRMNLYNLEKKLEDLSVLFPEIFDAYVEIMRIINSIPKHKMFWVINLVAELTYQKWEELTKIQQDKYKEYLGEEFIQLFNSNELITILLQSGFPELILKCSYVYPLFKMLFIVFGYSKLIPNIKEMDKCKNLKNKLQKHHEKTKGASFIRKGHDYDDDIFERSDESNCSNNNVKKYYKKCNCIKNKCTKCKDNCNCVNTDCCDECIDHPCHDKTKHKKLELEPVDKNIYEFIKLFGELYPTIIGLMGGTEQFPPESLQVNCHKIPNNYNDLNSIPEFLWRYNDFSYCRYLEYVNSKKFVNSVNSKINDKIKYLHTL